MGISSRTTVTTFHKDIDILCASFKNRNGGRSSTDPKGYAGEIRTKSMSNESTNGSGSSKSGGGKLGPWHPHEVLLEGNSIETPWWCFMHEPVNWSAHKIFLEIKWADPDKWSKKQSKMLVETLRCMRRVEIRSSTDEFVAESKSLEILTLLGEKAITIDIPTKAVHVKGRFKFSIYFHSCLKDLPASIMTQIGLPTTLTTTNNNGSAVSNSIDLTKKPDTTKSDSTTSGEKRRSKSPPSANVAGTKHALPSTPTTATVKNEPKATRTNTDVDNSEAQANKVRIVSKSSTESSSGFEKSLETNGALSNYQSMYQTIKTLLDEPQGGLVAFTFGDDHVGGATGNDVIAHRSILESHSQLAKLLASASFSSSSSGPTTTDIATSAASESVASSTTISKGDGAEYDVMSSNPPSPPFTSGRQNRSSPDMIRVAVDEYPMQAFNSMIRFLYFGIIDPNFLPTSITTTPIEESSSKSDTVDQGQNDGSEPMYTESLIESETSKTSAIVNDENVAASATTELTTEAPSSAVATAEPNIINYSWEDLYRTASRFEITELQRISLEKIQQGLEHKDAVGFLFRSGYMYKDLREFLVNIIAKDIKKLFGQRDADPLGPYQGHAEYHLITTEIIRRGLAL